MAVDLASDPILDEQIAQLRAKVERLKNENQSVKEKIENTNSSVSTYISEMTSMIDSNDFGALMSPSQLDSLAGSIQNTNDRRPNHGEGQIQSVNHQVSENPLDNDFD